ncbi:hypothetical protein [Gilliamella apicola]|uniref:hypothetical protein n=1 Tax=Gilliamella apicola TaxID=1196095 RepID=UPI0015E88B46|nr:hypothetical protein [Gilliamella apicola]
MTRVIKLDIGKQLIKTIEKHIDNRWAIGLLAAPQTVDYYAHIGFNAHLSAWILREQLK